MPKAGGYRCCSCGRQKSMPQAGQDKVGFTKCIKCGRVFCSNCWQPEYWEICPSCSTGNTCS